jgi:peptidyl-prolyl cis-trans isomerase B (cyclophilin B)
MTNRMCDTLTRGALAGVLVLCSAGPLLGRAQDGAGAPAQPPPGLRAELQALRVLYNPDFPIRLRFLLMNTADEPADLPLAEPVAAGDGITLPLQLVVGTGAQRPLKVIHGTETPVEVAPPAAVPPPADAVQVLRLAPHGTVGLELDLRAAYPEIRYSGEYRVEWQPLDGQLGTASATFRIEPRKDAIIVFDQGKLTCVLDYEGAPRNVENFLELVRSGFYSGKTVHRVIPGFILQGGCPKGDGTGTRPDGRLMPAELRDIPVDVGTVMMAHKPSDPNSASCQFFVALARVKELDGQYTVIGQARDPESLRTLAALGDVSVDERDRPLSPLIIRSINLVDSDQDRVRHLESSPPVKSVTATSAPSAQP